jgi:ubiquinone/menaquinone biosynthesis C-methylase UbiE
MSVFDYFSKDANKRAKFMFGSIAPIYARVDHSLVKGYEASIEVVQQRIDIKEKTVLDIGTGTGAWAMKFVQKGAINVQGVDLSKKILKAGKEKHPEITFSIANAENLKEFPDNSFDIVTASFVIHGVKKDRRKQMLLEMKRVSKKHVVIHDFVGKTHFFIRFLEFIEKSDYKNFKKHFCTELKQYYKNTQRIASDYGSGIYFGEK